jgi:hypothetical protein
MTASVFPQSLLRRGICGPLWERLSSRDLKSVSGGNGSALKCLHGVKPNCLHFFWKWAVHVASISQPPTRCAR